MSCGMIAMINAGVEVDNYYAYEIDKYAIQTTQHNFPKIKQCGDVFKADYTQYEGIDYLIGGSPCTHWSIAQSPDKRETTASGIGWDLFSQYVRALREAKPKYFIYENNKSMSKEIRKSITETFGFEDICINSALVSAQNRQRLYWIGKRNPDGTYSKVNVAQPEDKGIVLKDVLDGMTDRDKGRYVIASIGRTTEREYFKKNQGNMTFEPVNTTSDNKAQCIRATCYKDGIRNMVGNMRDRRTCVAEPVNITDGGKSQTIKSQYSHTDINNICKYKSTYGATGVAEPVSVAQRGRYNDNGTEQHIESRTDNKSNCVTTVQKDSMVAEPVRCFTLPREDGIQTQSKQYRVYSNDGKSTTLCAEGGGMGAKTGLYAVPIKVGEVGNGGQGNRIYTSDGKAVTQQANSGGLGSHTGLYAIPVEFENDKPIKAVSGTDGKTYKVYEVTNGMITIKDKTYPIKLQDGLYIIRKLTVSECKRLQTVPEWYEFPVSDTQCYRLLGNGWTCDVITHLIKATLN